MGNGVIQQAPDYENFRKFSEEYDRLKHAGLSPEEMHGILCHRLRLMGRQGAPLGPALPAVAIEDYGGGGKENAVRQGETTLARGESRKTIVSNNINSSSSAAPLSTKAPLARQPSQEQPVGTVLLIDDSPVAAKVASKVLVQQRFEVIIANAAKTGFDILLNRKDDISLIFLDVVMPEVDGVECLGWIKDDASVAHIPVYMLSGLEDQMLTDVCIERGAEGMLLKPLNPDMVRTIMQTHAIGAKLVAEEPSWLLSSNKPLIAQSLSVVIPKNDFEPENTSTSMKYDQSAVSKKINIHQLTIGTQAPAFKLIDSELREFTFPNPSSRKNVLLLFIPTIFCTYIFEERGFLMRCFAYYDQLMRNNSLLVCCISADLPFALAAAKKRFQLPFTLLSDPTLFVALRYVGSIDVGRLMTRLDMASSANNRNDVVSCDHKQNSFIGPDIGMVLLNRRRDVLNKWVARPGLFDSRKTLQEEQFPDKFDEWVTMACQIAAASPRRTPTAMKDARSPPAPTREHSKEKEKERDDSRSVKASRPETRSSTVTDHQEPSSGSSAASSTAELKSSKPDSAPANSSKGKPNILVVDDSSVSSRVCGKKLELMGFHVHTAYNGQQAFDLLRKKPPTFFSVILSDVVMPVCDGIGLLKLIKAEEAYKNIPILMMSGLEGEELSKNCLELGANALLKKPFDDAKFMEAIKGFNVIL